jgi:hypothetical protein
VLELELEKFDCGVIVLDPLEVETLEAASEMFAWIALVPLEVELLAVVKIEPGVSTLELDELLEADAVNVTMVCKLLEDVD